MARLSVECLTKRWRLADSLLREAFDDLAVRLRLPREALVDLTVCTDVRIARLNREHFGKRGATDVIAFPVDFPEVASGGVRYLGQIFVSADAVARNARRLGLDVSEEFLFVVIHGLLHLQGWRDGDPAERDRMLARGRSLLGSVRGLIEGPVRLLRRASRRGRGG